jgi:dTDP-4-dehydrorhamnose reductase
MKILLVGARGQLGSDLLQILAAAGHQVVPVDHSGFDVCSTKQVDHLIEVERPDFVINTAAFHKVEECEEHALRSFEVNAVGPLNLARACSRSKVVLVHFSTDYVFDGRKQAPYEESDIPSPLNAYGASKLAGENLVACNAERYFIVRTCGLYGHAGSSGKGGNFVETMLKKAVAGETIRVVNDQVLTPTSTADLALLVSQLIKTEAFGLYHASCEGACSWYEFAREIFAVQNLPASVVPVRTEEFASSVKRPSYSVLSKRRLNHLRLSMPDWRTSLERYLRARIKQHRMISA